jgi:hypothetical protein
MKRSQPGLFWPSAEGALLYRHSRGVSLLPRFALYLCCTITVLQLGSRTLDAAIIGVVPASNTISYTFKVGGVLTAASGPLALQGYQSSTHFGAASVPAGFVSMDVSYKFNDDLAKVFISDLAPVSIASQGAPAPGVGPVEIEGLFSIAFAIDAAGTPAVTIPIAYPIAFGGVAGTADSFDAEVDYTSTALGFLGTSEVHFAFAGPGGSPFFVLSGLDLALLALPGLDTLTLSGSFKLMADGFPGGSTEIEVFGIPEPSTMALGVIGGLAFVVGARCRRR